MAAVSQPPSAEPPGYLYSAAAWGPTRSPPDARAEPPARGPALSPPLVAMIAVVGTALLIVLYARFLARPLRRMRSRWRRRRRRMALSPADLDGASPPRNPGGAGDYGYYYYYNSSGGSSNHFLYSPYGLDDAAIKALPVSMFTAAPKQADAGGGRRPPPPRECAVCLLEFEEGDSVRTLPLCAHAFHADCIDVWLRSHANCPLCRAAIFPSQQQPQPQPQPGEGVGAGGWPPPAAFAPMRAARIRPSFDDFLLNPPPVLAHPHHHPLVEQQQGAAAAIPESPDRGGQQEPEIVAATEPSPPRMMSEHLEQDDDEYEDHRRDGNLLLLSRSYSFGFERSLGGPGGVGGRDDDRIGSSSFAATTPWRYPRGARGPRSSFWSKRWPSPFAGGGADGSASAPRPSASGAGGRVFSFRSYLGVGSYLRSSPFFQRGRRSSFLPLSESRAGAGGPAPSSRRTRSMTMLSSPAAFLPPTAAGPGSSSRGGWGWGGPAATSSRHRCGDPEALLSPERLDSSGCGNGNGR